MILVVVVEHQYYTGPYRTIHNKVNNNATSRMQFDCDGHIK